LEVATIKRLASGELLQTSKSGKKRPNDRKQGGNRRRNLTGGKRPPSPGEGEGLRGAPGTQGSFLGQKNKWLPRGKKEVL